MDKSLGKNYKEKLNFNQKPIFYFVNTNLVTKITKIIQENCLEICLIFLILMSISKIKENQSCNILRVLILNMFALVFCCVVACFQPDFFGCQQDFFCCLKIKSAENIFGYIREQFYRFSRGCKPRENL